jgi:hypothetical protein
VKRWKGTIDSNTQNHAQVGFARFFLLLFCSNDKKVERQIMIHIPKSKENTETAKIRKKLQ